MPGKPRLIIAAVGLTVILLIAISAFGYWLANPHQAEPAAASSLISDSVVKVDQEPWLIFEPRVREATTGLILYPGGRVVAEAYAPAARSLAEQGFLTIIVPMPANLAVLAPDSATKVIKHFNVVETWVVGGHSLGGAMAARYAYLHPDKISGLVLWASYPARSNDLGDSQIKTVVIYGSQDQIATPNEILGSSDRLPASTRFETIEGGNHAQFGWYGSQSGDGQAKISHELQQQIIIDATSQLLQGISSDGGVHHSSELSLAKSVKEPGGIVETVNVR